MLAAAATAASPAPHVFKANVEGREHIRLFQNKQDAWLRVCRGKKLSAINSASLISLVKAVGRQAHLALPCALIDNERAARPEWLPSDWNCVVGLFKIQLFTRTYGPHMDANRADATKMPKDQTNIRMRMKSQTNEKKWGKKRAVLVGGVTLWV